MNYTTDLKMQNLRGSSKEYMNDNFPNLIESLSEQIEQLARLEIKEMENLEAKGNDKDYIYFKNNKWAHFSIGLFAIRGTKERLQGYIKKLEKDMNKPVKEKKEHLIF